MTTWPAWGYQVAVFWPLESSLLLFYPSVMWNSLWPHRLQHTRLPCPPLSSRVFSNSCPLICDAIQPSSSVSSFSSCLQSFPASGSFPMNQLFASGGQNIGVSVAALPVKIQGWFPFDWLIWSPCSPRESQESSLAPHFESINSSTLSLLYGPTLTPILEKPWLWLYRPLPAKWHLCFLICYLDLS